MFKAYEAFVWCLKDHFYAIYGRLKKKEKKVQKIQRGILLTGETHKYLQQVCVIAVCFASPIALPNRKCVLQIYSCIENKGTTNCSDGTINCADGTINCASGINNCSTGTNICADGTRNLIKG